MSAHAEYVTADNAFVWIVDPGEYAHPGAEEPVTTHALVVSTIDDTHLVIEGTLRELTALLSDATDLLSLRVAP